MNFLAHIYLSGDDEHIQIGNFMADGIRGMTYLDYPELIQKGILLHRAIDSFTDMHPIYRKSKHRLHEKYGHYSGVIMDIVYDHFLAKNWKKYHTIPLEQFSLQFYKRLKKNEHLVTEKTKNLMPYMIASNWLLTYATVAGLEKILFQMDYRTKHVAQMHHAIQDVQDFYTLFEEEFTLFFEEICIFSQEKLRTL